MKENLKDERILILNMVHEGKITVEEGIKLLESIKNDSGEECIHFDMEDKINKFSSSVDSFAKEIGSKIGTVYKDAEPKIKKATKKALEKTSLVIEDISNALSESAKNIDKNKSKDDTKNDDNTEDTNNPLN